MTQLKKLDNLSAAIAMFKQNGVSRYEPKIVKLEEGYLSLYAEDQSYDIDEWLAVQKEDTPVTGVQGTGEALTSDTNLPMHRLMMSSE